jgi:dTMP kinase
MKGKFITFEGIEGCGKTTQIKLLDEHLQKNGYKTLLTREPGGTEIGDKIRQILLDPSNKKMCPTAELLLYGASRAQHIEELINPALFDGKIVLCDRYSDSTTAYQGAARRLDLEKLDEMDKIATSSLKPDLTIVIDISARDGLKRATKRGQPDRLEQEKLDFHERVRKGYLNIAKKEPNRVLVVDGNKDIGTVHRNIIAGFEKIIGKI